MALSAKDIIDKASKLKGSWSTRDDKIKDWYNVLTLKDELKQEGLESVTSNDPRTGFNLGKHLMTSSIVAHKIPIDGLEPEEVTATSYLEEYQTRRWSAEEQRYRKIGRQSFKGQLVAFMLATGWYSMFSMVDENHAWSEVWHPMEVYPDFGPDGVVSVAHIYPLSPAAANRKAKLMGWTLKNKITHNVSLYDLWEFDDDGDVANGIVLGTDLVKSMVKEPILSELNMLPIFISPVGGLPDSGAIMKGKDWQKHFGEGIVATNEDLTKNYNKMLSFIQQAARSAAQHRWYEKSTGETPILTEENIDKWGAIYRMGPGDEVGPILPPAIPVELRTIMFEYSNMLQRGLFPWAIFGNVQQQLSYLAMANIASAALQVLTPYMDAFRGVMSDVDNFQFKMMKAGGFRPHGFVMPENLPEEFEFDVQADIEIPGFLIQRATVARMLDPTFRLPTRFVMDRMFPEVRDPLRSMAETRRDDAMMHPKAIIADQIIAYRDHARMLRDMNDADSAKLYEKLADSLEAELGIPQQTAPTTMSPEAQAAQQSILREAFPTREATAPVEGVGRI